MPYTKVFDCRILPLLATCLLFLSVTSTVGQTTSSEESGNRYRGESVEIQFTSFKGSIALNRNYIGEVESLSYFGPNGLERAGDISRDVRDRKDEPLVLNAPEAGTISRISVTGSRGNIILERMLTPVAAPKGIIWPLAGMIEIASGRIVETVQAAETVTLMDRLPSEHSVTIGGSVTDVVAMRAGEIAIAGDDIDLAPQGATVRISAPGGLTASGEVPAWGHKVYLQPVTDLNAWVPIFAQVTGLFADEIVDISFLPGPGQRIEPRHVTITGSQATDGMTIAHFLTLSEGDQVLSFDLRRMPAPPAIPDDNPSAVVPTDQGDTDEESPGF